MTARERIEKKIMPLSYYKAGGVHTGSVDSMRYVIKKETADDTDSLFVCAWPGPFTYDATKDELKKSTKVPVSEEGLAQAVHWLAGAYEASAETFSKPISLLDIDNNLKDTIQQ